MPSGQNDLELRFGANLREVLEGMRELQTEVRRVSAEMQRQLGGAGARVSSQMQGTTRAFASLKQELSRGRESALFFGRALGDLAPAGSLAQSAIGGLGGALLGAGGLLIALEGLRAILNAVSSAFVEANKRFEDSKKALEGATAKAKDAADQYRILAAEASGGAQAAAEARFQIEVNKILGERQRIQDEIAKKQDELTEIQGSAIIFKKEEWALENEIAALKQALVELEHKLGSATLEYEKAERAAGAAAVDAAERATEGKEKETEARARNVKQMEREAQLRREEELKLATAAASTSPGEFMSLESGALGGSAYMDAQDMAAARAKQAAQEVQAAWENAGQAIGQAMGQAFAGVITGSMTAGEAVAMVAKQMLMVILDLAVKSIMASALKAGGEAASSQAGIPVVGPALAAAAMAAMITMVRGLIGSLPGRAMGGSVSYGTPYVVGERGPEVFRPNSAGTIVPNHALGGGPVTLNVYALDSADVERFLRRNTRGVARALSEMQRDGRL